MGWVRDCRSSRLGAAVDRGGFTGARGKDRANVWPGRRAPCYRALVHLPVTLYSGYSRPQSSGCTPPGCRCDRGDVARKLGAQDQIRGLQQARAIARGASQPQWHYRSRALVCRDAQPRGSERGSTLRCWHSPRCAIAGKGRFVPATLELVPEFPTLASLRCDAPLVSCKTTRIQAAEPRPYLARHRSGVTPEI